MRAVWIWKCRANLFRLPPCRSHPLGPTNTRRFYRVGRQCTRQYEGMSRRAKHIEPVALRLKNKTPHRIQRGVSFHEDGKGSY